MNTLSLYLSQGLKYILLGFIPSCLTILLCRALVPVAKAHATRKRSHMLWLFASIWYAFSLLLIVFGRSDNSYSSANFELFLCYRQMFTNFSAISCINVILNIALFIPFGFLFSIPLNKKSLSLGVSGRYNPLSCNRDISIYLFYWNCRR